LQLIRKGASIENRYSLNHTQTIAVYGFDMI